jgi:hypothetical protein
MRGYDVRARLVMKAALVATTAATTLLGFATGAWAPKYILGASAFGTCTIDGETSRFQGSFTVLGFFVGHDGLSVTANIVGSCTDQAATTVAVVNNGNYAFPVEHFEALCDDLNQVVRFRPGGALVAGTLEAPKDGSAAIALDLSGDVAGSGSTIVQRAYDNANDAASVRAKLCAVAKITAHRSPAELAKQLNQLVLG